MQIEVAGLNKAFGAFQALRDASITIPDGQLVALLGPSGSGKTTVLRIIAGLEAPDSGRVAFGDVDATHLAPSERRVGFVFQHYALFRHMTVFENVAFGLRVKPRHARPSEEEIRQRVTNLLKLIQLESQAQRRPNQLSGGQRQRVALARALAVEPQVLLLDEPFGALDARVRQDLRRWLRRLHDQMHVTSVLVTHDVDEALEVADQVVVMNAGRVEQVGTPDHVYEHPASPFVYSFLGNVNVFPLRTHEERTRAGKTPAAGSGGEGLPETALIGCARPHELDITRDNPGQAAIAVSVAHVLPVGPIVRVSLRRLDTGVLLEAEVNKEQFRRLNLVTGESVYANPLNIRYFPEDYSI